MLRTSSYGLHRSPHVTVAGYQIPPRCLELTRFDLPPDIDWVGGTLAAIFQRSRPREVAIAFHYGMCATQLGRLFRIERGVDPAENHIRATTARDLPNL